MKRWQRFEKLTEKIFRDLSSVATVVWDDHILGQQSDSKRQVDVSIRWRSNDEEYLTIVQAKDYKPGSPADINVVGEFKSVIEDVGANRGILVCNAGFTQKAHTYARAVGIDLYNLHDAESHDWSRDLKIPILWIDLTPSAAFQLSADFLAGDQVTPDEKLPFRVSPDQGIHKIDLTGLFMNAWNSQKLATLADVEHRVTFPAGGLAVGVQAEDGRRAWRPVHELSISYVIKTRAWLGHFRPAECRGLIDYLDQAKFVASYLPMHQIPAQRDESWAEVGDPREVAISTRGTVVTSENVEFLSQDGLTLGEVQAVLVEPAGAPGTS